MLPGSPVSLPLLTVAAEVYGGLIAIRNWLYQANCIPVRRLACPVISVGNLTLGGTGKTPLVIHLARVLLELGMTPAILSRGYRRLRATDTRIISPESSVENPSDLLGDEPALIRRAVPEAWLGLSADRFHAGEAILRECANPVFLLDDGFQHRKLHRDLDLLILDPTQPLVENRLLPRGTLREPLTEIARANALIIPECGAVTTEFKASAARFHRGVPIFHVEQRRVAFIPFSDWKRGEAPGTALDAANKVYLVAAIGNPERFQRDMVSAGFSIAGRRFFRDHHHLGYSDWKLCVEEARRDNAAAIVMTEKDAVKTSHPPDFPTYVCSQEIAIHEAGALRTLLRTLIEKRP